MPTDEHDLPADPSPTVARLYEGALSDSVPDTFLSEAELLLKHLKFGAAAPSAGGNTVPAPKGAAAADTGAFPLIPGYEIECELGRGGMGVVYKARHAALRHTVAIKMILASAHSAPAEVARFIAEAEAVAAVKHPNVVQVFDLGVTPGPGPDADRPYFVMECVDGGSLAGYLKGAGGKLGADATAELIEAVARGVDAANAAGIVHRDLKPGNILLAGFSIQDSGFRKKEASSSSALNPESRPLTPVPKVSDFGLAKRLSSDMTRTQAVMGTPAYMAPEQAGGKAKFVGPPADVYALGVILYQCLTGAVPFDDPDPWSLIRRVLEDTPAAPRSRVANVPRDLELICLKCLEKEPHHRYPTAGDLADDLRRFLNREAVSVRPIGAPTKMVRWAKKRPTAAGLAAVGVLLAVSIPAVAVGVRSEFAKQDAVSDQARLTAEEARRAEEEAKKAKGAAEREAVAFKQLAEVEELFGLRTKLLTRAAARPRGWTAETLAELPRAVQLARGKPAVVEDLRSVAATALLSDDLFPVGPVAQGMTAAALATDPNTGLVAVGEYKAWRDCTVLLIDPRTGAKVRALYYPTQTLKGKKPLEIVQDGTRALVFSPDGTRLFVGTRGGQIARFDLTAGSDRPAAIWQATTTVEADRLAVSSDGKTVYAAGRSEDPVRSWDAATGAKGKDLTLPAGERAHGIAALPDGGVVVSTSGKLCYWGADGAPRETAPVLEADNAGLIAVGPGSMLLVGANQRLEVRDRFTPWAISQFVDPALRRTAHASGIYAIAVHPSGAFAATVGDDHERVVRVWELASGRLAGAVVVPGAGPVRPAWSGDGEILLATAAGQVVRWRLAAAPARRFVCGTGLLAETATFLPDGRAVTLSEQNGWRRELMVGRAGGASEAFAAVDPGGFGRAGLSAGPDGRLAMTVSTNGLNVWAPKPPLTSNELTKYAIRSPRFSGDGRTLWAVFGSLIVRAIDPTDKSFRGTWDNTVADKLTGLGTIETLAAGRAMAAAATRDGSVYLLDTACKRLATLRKPGDPVLTVAVAADDSLVAAGTQGGNLRLIRTADEVELPTIAAHPTGVSAVAFGAGGLLATGGRDRTVRLWARAGDSYEPLLTVSGLPDAVRELQFHPTDGRLLVLLDRQHAAQVWDVARLNAKLGEHKIGW